MFALLVMLSFASAACANETLWNAVKKAHDSNLEEDWKAVEVIIKTDKTVDKYYAPEGEQAVFHYLIAACQFALAELIVEMDPSVVEVPKNDEVVFEERDFELDEWDELKRSAAAWHSWYH